MKSSKYSAIIVLWIAYGLAGSIISSMGQKLAAATDQEELIMPMISQMVMGVVGSGMVFSGSIIMATLIAVVLFLLAKSESHQGRFLTALTMGWMILLGGVLFVLVGFTLPFIQLLE